MTTAEEYRTASTTLYDQAMVELDAGDTGQASEKLWGAAAQALKSLAEQRGWRHNTHAEFYRIMTRLEDEVSDRESRRNFDSATQLHVNFYENWLSERQIRTRSDDIEHFIRQLARL